MKQFSKGFTLIELMVTVTLIMVIAALGLSTYSGAQLRARNTKRIGDMKAVQAAFEQYFAINRAYSANCATMTSASNMAQPTETKTGHTAYVYSCTTTSYYVRATMEGTGGNSDSATCAGNLASTGAYYCVVNQQ